MDGCKKPDNALRSKLLGYQHHRGGEPSTSGTTNQRFIELAARCRKDAGSIGEAAAIQHPAWLEIVSLGEEVIPFMLESLERDSTEFWLSALQRITGVNPATGHKADRAKAAAAWLDWGRQRGISWNYSMAGMATDNVLISKDGNLVTVEIPTKLAKITPEEAERLAAMLIRAARSIGESGEAQSSD